ncbi:hypothetical protein M408DRAFT_289096 [Serendipita vermifera MAFF 305830]|uniref:Glutathione hydrolase n=1 Tax=Serendipita vermifera MAFF 305830 TaxID=933852 RepID=A0A0C2XNX5_SERVB|nr:hypothetical protein M408DRAFT_289096 [Serendipita vermifera MAFF 305830]
MATNSSHNEGALTRSASKHHSLAPSRRSVSFVGGINHPDADRYEDERTDDEREPLLTTVNGRKRSKQRLTALFNGRRRSYDDLETRHGRTEEQEPRPWKAVLAISFAVLAVLFVIVAAGLVVATNPIPGHSPHHPFPGHRNPSYLIHATHGAVASESETCSKIGVGILREGGNAVDAAIAATLCIGVVNMFSSGIGGGGFMTIKLPGSEDENNAWTVDFRETAPTGSNSTMFLKDPTSSIEGGLAVGVPGEIRGMAAAHERWGQLPWKRLFAESIKLAEEFTASEFLELRLQNNGQFMLNNTDWSSIFAPNGRLARAGEKIKRTNYARTLRTIAENGPEAFYTGYIANSIIAKINATGGIMTHHDLESYKPIIQPALQGTYQSLKGYPPRRIYTTHAPTSGPVVLHILNLLEGYNLAEEGPTPLNIHRVVESLKFGFAARTRICDPAFLKNSTQISEIPTKDYAKRIFPNITDDRTHTAEYYNPIFDVPIDHGTTHTSVVDRDGMAVALTSTVNLIFGSKVLDPVTGIILNDEMDDFSKPGLPNFFGLWPSPYNYPAPGKRPLSSTAPTIVTQGDDTFFLALGGSGGSLIFPSIVQTILNVEWGLDIRQAIEAPRVFDQLFPASIIAETTYSQPVLDALVAKGHNVTMYDIMQSIAAIQGVMQDDGRITAASDSRKHGVAAGY